MAHIEIILPAMGEGIIEAEVTRWLVSEGDRVETDQPVVEIATDKVDSEVPATENGILRRILIGEGETARIGQALAVIDTEVASAADYGSPDPVPGETKSAGSAGPAEGKGKESEVEEPSREQREEPAPTTFPDHPSPTHFLSQAVRTLIRKNSLSDDELATIQGTGNRGKIMLSDIKAYLTKRNNGHSEKVPTSPEHTKSKEKSVELSTEQAIGDDLSLQDPPGSGKLIPEEVIYGDEENEVIEMDRMRKIIARQMSYSKQVSPHVNSFIETDVTELVFWRERVKSQFFDETGQKLTITPLLLSAVIKAIKDFPRINISVDGDRIILKKKINLGMATALRDGNLIVPVIKDADKLSFNSLVSRVNDLADRSRNKKLQPEEIIGGTFTVTNLGPFGSLSGTPIIKQPEAAILALGAIKKKPAVIETDEGEAIGIRRLMIMCLAYDHRVIDGALAGMFLKRIADILEHELPVREFRGASL